MILHEVAGFLGDQRRKRILSLLESPVLEWARADCLGRTTRGRVWQLANRAMHTTLEMRQLSTLLAGAIYDELTATIDLPEPADLLPQVFPVKMYGNPEEPPAQIPHIDGSPSRRPLITSLYYAHVKGITGGNLCLHETRDVLAAKVVPRSDHLTAIPGQQLHSVEPMTTGTRITIVTNFYPLSRAN